MRQTSNYRNLALATALADGVSQKEIVRSFALKWQIERETVRQMLVRLVNLSKLPPTSIPLVCRLAGAPTEQTRDRMTTLTRALETGEARGDVVKAYAAAWAVTGEWVEQLITRALVETRAELHAQIHENLARYAARIRANLAKYAAARDYPPASVAYARLALLER